MSDKPKYHATVPTPSVEGNNDIFLNIGDERYLRKVRTDHGIIETYPIKVPASFNLKEYCYLREGFENSEAAECWVTALYLKDGSRVDVDFALFGTKNNNAHGLFNAAWLTDCLQCVHVKIHPVTSLFTARPTWDEYVGIDIIVHFKEIIA